MVIDNERDRLTLPTTSWWLACKTREQLREAIEREAERMRQSKIGGALREIGTQPSTLALSARREQEQREKS